MKCRFAEPIYVKVDIPAKSRDWSFKVKMEIISLRQSWARYGPNRNTAIKAAARKALLFMELLRNAEKKQNFAQSEEAT